MKPCSKNRKLIAWLAVDALAAPQARELRAHVQTCPGCRRYLDEIAGAAKKLAAVEIAPDIQTSESFHRRVLRALQAEPPRSFWETVTASLRPSSLSWRVALPAVVAMVIAGVALTGFRRHSGAPLPVQPLARPVPTATLKRDFPPTLSNYQIVANRSPEALDELLTSQARRNPAPTRIYTASTRAGFDPQD